MHPHGSDRWRITWDGDQLEDEYDERPSEFEIRQTQRACPDTPVRLWRLIGGVEAELVEERAPGFVLGPGHTAGQRPDLSPGPEPATLAALRKARADGRLVAEMYERMTSEERGAFLRAHPKREDDSTDEYL